MTDFILFFIVFGIIGLTIWCLISDFWDYIQGKKERLKEYRIWKYDEMEKSNEYSDDKR